MRGGVMADEAPATDVQAMLDWAITQCPVGVALVDDQMRQLHLNLAMCRIFGLESEAAGLGRQLTDLISTPGTEAVLARAREVVRTGEPAVWRGFGHMPGDPIERVWDVTLAPVKDPAGRVRGVLVVEFDVTEHHRARERLALVNQASTRIGSTLDVGRTAEELVEVSVPRLADFAVVDLLDSVLRGDEPAPAPWPAPPRSAGWRAARS